MFPDNWTKEWVNNWKKHARNFYPIIYINIVHWYHISSLLINWLQRVSFFPFYYWPKSIDRNWFETITKLFWTNSHTLNKIKEGKEIVGSLRNSERITVFFFYLIFLDENTTNHHACVIITCIICSIKFFFFSISIFFFLFFNSTNYRITENII